MKEEYYLTEEGEFLNDLISEIEERFGNIDKLDEVNKNGGSIYSLAKKFGITDDDIYKLYDIYHGYMSELPEGYDINNHSVTVFTRNGTQVDKASYIIAALTIAKFEESALIIEKITNGFVDNYLTIKNTFVIDADTHKIDHHSDDLFTLIDICPRIMYLDKETNSVIIDNRHLRYLHSKYDPEDVIKKFNTETGEIHLERVSGNSDVDEDDYLDWFDGIRDDKIACKHDRDSLMIWAIYNHPSLAAEIYSSEGGYDEQDEFLDYEDNGVFMKLKE